MVILHTLRLPVFVDLTRDDIPAGGLAEDHILNIDLVLVELIPLGIVAEVFVSVCVKLSLCSLLLEVPFQFL